MVFKMLKNLLAAGFMIVSLASILATSQSTQSINNAGLYVISDCVVPTLEANVNTVNGQIIAPIGRSYTDFGFPQSIVTLDSTVTGSLFGKIRSCMLTYGDKSNGTGWIYSCYDNNTFTCTIMVEPQ